MLLGIMKRCHGHDRRQPFGTERVVSEDVDCVFSTKEAVLEDVGALSLRTLVPKYSGGAFSFSTSVLIVVLRWRLTIES